MEHSLEFDIKILIIRCGSRPSHRIWSFHVFVLRTTKWTKNYNARALSLVWTSNLLFSDVPDAE